MRLNEVIQWVFSLAGCAGAWIAIASTRPVLAQPATAQPGAGRSYDSARSPSTADLHHEPAAADRPQAAAATTAAIDNLRDEITREPLTPRMTVAEFLRRAGGTDALVRELAHADPLGGPRWLDAQTCQVQLEISGSRLSRILTQIASSKSSPLTPIEIEQLTVDWRRRAFTATGSSTDFTHVIAARPRSSNVTWLSVPDADRRRALLAARDDAFARVLSSVRLVPLGRTATVADALALGDVHDTVVAWLSQLPVTRVNYRRDLQVELTFSTTPDDLFAAVRTALDKHPGIDVPTTDADWSRIRHDFVERMDPAIGRGMASPDATARTSIPGPAIVVPPTNTGVRPTVPNTIPRERVHIPLGMPRWASDQIAASGLVDANPSKLKAARQAEALARRKLIEQIESLPLTGTQTIGDAAARDPNVRDAITRAVDRAHIEKTDYYHGSDVQVQLRLDLRDVWDELKALP